MFVYHAGSHSERYLFSTHFLHESKPLFSFEGITFQLGELIEMMESSNFLPTFLFGDSLMFVAKPWFYCCKPLGISRSIGLLAYRVQLVVFMAVHGGVEGFDIRSQFFQHM